jgi:hypothetical protein
VAANQNLSAADAYRIIRAWYQSPAKSAVEREVNARRAELERSLGQAIGPIDNPHPLAAALPANPSDLEMKAVFREVIAGKLEFACPTEVAGRTLHAIAHDGAARLGGYTLTDEEVEQLRGSPLFPHISLPN